MFCPNCGKELPNGSRFCPNCGHQTAADQPKGSTVTLSSKTLLVVTAVAIVVLLAVLALLLLRPGQSESGEHHGQNTGQSQEQETPEPDPADALVGTWTNSDGIGLTFTASGSLRLSGFGLSLGGDTFTYEIQDENTLYLTTDNALSLGFTAPYGIVGDTLFIQIAEYSFELTKK